jgi:hypothetical protein
MVLSSLPVAAQLPAYPVRASTNGRYLVDQNSQPFLINGESAWLLIEEISREDATLFLNNRRQKGFNTFNVMLMNREPVTNTPRNFYGDIPFTTPGDFNTPNEAYFAHADWVINAAAASGQVIMLAPLYLGWDCVSPPQGWCNEVKNSSLTTMRNFGRYIGNRYKNFPNIIWLMGGDANAVSQGVSAKMEEFIAGLREFDQNHLITVHNNRNSAGAAAFPNAPWLTLNSLYTDNITYNQAATEYNRTPVRPAFLVEAYYENENGSTPLRLRSQAYWTVLAGGLAGHIFGNCPVTAFSSGLGACANPNWQSNLESTGAATVALVGKLFQSRAYYNLVPDLSHQVVTAGFESGQTYATTARTGDGASVIVYIPTRRAITMDMTKVAGTTARVWWFNPRTGGATLAGNYPTTGSLQFTPADGPPDNNDWVLVADNAALNLGAPGSSAPVLVPSIPVNFRVQ